MTLKSGTGLGLPTSPVSNLHQSASKYATRFQFSVFPCRPQAKEPLTQHGCKDATRDTVVIAAWWRQWPNANVAIACGIPSGGLLVLDVDGDEGQDSLRELEKTHGELPRTPQVVTGKGLQFYFRSSQSFKNRVGVAPGIDIRSDGGYVIAPPSIHPNGRTYSWEISSRIDEVPVAAPPDWLVKMLAESESKSGTGRDWKPIAEAITSCGSRNQTLASLAGHLLRRYVDPTIANLLLQAWNRCCTEQPLPDDEFERTVESIARLELARRQRGVSSC